MLRKWFVKRSEWDALYERLKEQRELIRKLEYRLDSETAPFRVGTEPNYFSGCDDYRPTITQREAIEAILSHLKLELAKTDAVPARVVLKKLDAAAKGAK